MIIGDRLAGIEAIGLIISSLIILIYFVALYKIFILTKNIYGGRFSSLIPYLSAGTALLLLKAVFEGVMKFLFPAFYEIAAFQAGLNTIQIIAGLFFLSAFYQLYHIRFATVGFLEKKAKGR